jgi:hypothetical protein
MTARRSVRAGLVGLGIVASLAMALAEPAAAGSSFHVPEPVGGPALAGGAPVWAEQRPDEGVNIRRRDPRSGAVNTLFRSSISGQDSYGYGWAQFARIAGSGSTLAVQITAYANDCFNFPCFSSIFAGPAARPLTAAPSSGCRVDYNQNPDTPQPLDVDRTRVVYYDCAHGSLDVTDLKTGQTTQVPGGFRGLRVAGRYLAWVPGGGPFGGGNTIEVYDWKAKQRVYTIPMSVTNGTVGDLDLAPDGTVVWPIGTGNPGERLAWASPRSPRPHTIPVAQRDAYGVRFVGGRIAFERGQENGNIPRGEVGVTDLAGHVRLLATGADVGVFERQFDFDGKHVAWYAFACTGVRMHVQSIHARVIHESMTRCPLRFKRPPRVHQGRVVDLAVNCYGYSLGYCKGLNASLRLPSGAYEQVGYGRNAHYIILTPHGMKLLKKRKRLRLFARITMADLLGFSERRSGFVTLVHR